MNDINLQKDLFDVLIEDYYKYAREKKYQAQFQTAIDFFEAVIKFFAVLNISVVKETNKEVYKKIITEKFTEKPSLGHFAGLATAPFFKKTAKSLKEKNEFYDFLNDIFNTNTNLNGQLYSVKALLDDTEEKANQKVSELKELFDKYLVNFRNKLKGHAASFKENEKEQVKNNYCTTYKIIRALKKVINKVSENIKFYEDKGIIYAKYKDKKIELLPLMIYHDCNKYSCKKTHRVKIFFFNDKNNENIYFLDYWYNHFYNIKEDKFLKEKVTSFLVKLDNYKKEMKIFSYINVEDRKNKLLENFVGREEELKSVKDHIQNNQATFTYIIGKPGVGKSAFISKLLDEIDEKKYNKFLHYANRGNEGKDKESQLENIYLRLNTLIKESLGIKKEDNKEENITLNYKFENLFKLYQEKASKPLIIAIDGLDEYEDWEYIISNIPIIFSNKIHLIITSRDYNDMINYIENKVANYNSTVKVYTTENSKNRSYYLELGKLSDKEVAELISIAIPKEIKQSENYQEIINIIIEKSEALPLYLDYLINILKEENIELNEFKEWSEKLPEGIDEFYKDSFEKAEKIGALNILKLIYFSTQRVYKRDLRIIFNELKKIKELEITKKFDFEEAFNIIDILLEKTDGFYGFYHQSVKDALEAFLECQKEELFVLDDKECEKEKTKKKESKKKLEKILYFNPQKIVYLDEESNTFKLLKATIEFLKTKQSLYFYQTNFFHLYYQYIHFKMYQEMLSFNDVKQKNYEKILKYTQISNEIKDLIKEFFELFDKKEEKYKFEIRYAYNLAFLIGDYKRVLKYMDEYQNYLYDKFLDIALNIEKKEKVKEFIELKEDWINNIPQNLKDFYIEIIAKKEKLPDEFVEVMEFLDDKYKAELIGNINPQKALNIAESIKNKEKKSELLAYIAEKLADKELFDKALEIAENIEDEYYKSETLVYIYEKLAEKEKNETLFELAILEKYKKDKLINEDTLINKDFIVSFMKDIFNAYINQDENFFKNQIEKINDINNILNIKNIKKLGIKNPDSALFSIAKKYQEHILIYFLSKINNKNIMKTNIEKLQSYLMNDYIKEIIIKKLISMNQKKEAEKIIQTIKNKTIQTRLKIFLYKDKNYLKQIINNLNKKKFDSIVKINLVDNLIQDNNLKQAFSIIQDINCNDLYCNEEKCNLYVRLIKKLIQINNSNIFYFYNIEDNYCQCIAYIDLIHNKKIKEELEKLCNKLNNERKARFLAYKAYKTKKQDLFEKAIEMALSTQNKEYNLMFILKLMIKENFYKYKDVYKKLIENKELSFPLYIAQVKALVAQYINNKEKFEDALKEINNYVDYIDKNYCKNSKKNCYKKYENSILNSYILLYKINKKQHFTDEGIIINKILEKFSKFNYKYKIIKLLNKYNKDILNNILFKQYLIKNINIQKALQILSIISYENVLEYFGIKTEEKENILEGIDEEKIKNIKDMLNYGMPIEKVAEIIGVDVKIIEKIKNNI